jgi:putative ABC transport system permease protein
VRPGKTPKEGKAVDLAGSIERLMRALLFEVAATDGATFMGGAVGLLVVAALACYFPARRAMKVDPQVALRYE